MEPWRAPDDLHRAIVHNALDAILVVDRDLVVRYATPQIRTVGRDPDALVGTPFVDIFMPGEQARIATLMRGVGEQPDKRVVFQAGMTDPGRRRYAGHGECAACLLADGMILVCCRDVTLHHTAEDVLRGANHILSAVADAQSAYISNPDNPAAFERLLGALVDDTRSSAGLLAGIDDATSRVAVVASLGGAELGDALLARITGEHPSVVTLPPPGAALVLPVSRNSGELTGAVALFGSDGGYPDDIVERIRPLLSTAATLLNQRGDRRRRRRVERENELLKTLAAASAEAPDLSSALAIIIRTIAESTGWTYGGAWTRTFDGAALECSPAWYGADERVRVFREASTHLRFAPGEGLCGIVWQTKQPLWFDVDDPRVAVSRLSLPRYEFSQLAGMRLALVVPVLAGDEVTAVLEFASCEPHLNDDALDLALACTRQVGAMLERRRVELANTFLLTAMRDLQDGVRVVTPKKSPGGYHVVYANTACARMLGYDDAAEILGTPADADWGPATDRAGVARVWKELEAGRTARIEHTIYKRDGTALEIEATVSPVFDAGGKHTMTVNVFRDVGAVRRAAAQRTALEAAVQEADVAWRRTFDLIELPIVLVDADGKIERLNRAARDLAGIPYADAVGLPLTAFGAHEPWASASRLFRDTSATSPREVQAPDTTTGRTWDISLSASARTGGAILVARDVSATLQLQASLRRTETEAVLGRIVAGVAHEVRNPLFGIGATLDAFEARFGSAPDQANYLKVLRAEIARLAALMHELLDYGRPPSLSRTEVSARDLVAEALARCTASAQAAGVTLGYELPASPCTAQLDRARVLQLLINLIENAVQHSPAGGTVTVSCSCDWRRVTIAVEDEGTGIPEGDIVRVFEPFFTKRKGGTGLGLSLVQRIVEMHGGRVTAGNRAGRGAVMTVRLPVEATDGR